MWIGVSQIFPTQISFLFFFLSKITTKVIFASFFFLMKSIDKREQKWKMRRVDVLEKTEQTSKIKNYRDLTSSQYGIKRDGMPIRT